MSKAIKTILNSEIGVSVLYHTIRGFQSTYRFTVENEQAWMDRMASGGAIIICCWHQQFFSAIRHFRNYSHMKPPLMISKSGDGGVVAGIAIRTGWDIVRGSSSKGGSEALDEMVVKLRERRIAAHVVDGPRGPAGKVKAGLIRLAQLGEAAIAPFYVTAEKAWFFNSWDRFMVPKPFSRVILRFGNPIELLPISGPEDFERERSRIEEIMQPGLITR
jgi:lysophospholipid acyltransferase (LPLAT)-like uncharacterized protein